MSPNRSARSRTPSRWRVKPPPAPGIVTSFVELPVQLAWSKEMVPGTDVVSGRRPGLWPEVAASDEATAAGVQTSV